MTILYKGVYKCLFWKDNSLYYKELDNVYYSSIKVQKSKKIIQMDFHLFSIVV